MPEINRDGFRFAIWANNKYPLIFESDRLEECVIYCNAKRVTSLLLSPYHGYHLDNVDFLQHCPTVKEAYLQRGFGDYGGLYKAKSLTTLSAVFRNNINFSRIEGLTALSTDWNPAINGSLLGSSGLKQLWMRYYKPKSRDLNQLSVFRNLTELSIILSPINSLSGLEKFSGLNMLQLAYCPKLTEISLLAKLRLLTVLELDHCKRVADLTVIRCVPSLRKVILSDCGPIPTLKFIAKMPKLEFLSFVKTNVLDGDMTPCFKLKYAGFLKKRGYSHTPAEVRGEIIKRHHGESLYPLPERQ